MSAEQILYTGLTGCIAAIVFLFRLEQVHHADAKRLLGGVQVKLELCELERHKLAVRVAVLEVPARQIELIAAQVATELKIVAEDVARELKKLK